MLFNSFPLLVCLSPQECSWRYGSCWIEARCFSCRYILQQLWYLPLLSRTQVAQKKYRMVIFSLTFSWKLMLNIMYVLRHGAISIMRKKRIEECPRWLLPLWTICITLWQFGTGCWKRNDSYHKISISTTLLHTCK